MALAVLVSGCTPGQLASTDGQLAFRDVQYAQLPPEETLGGGVTPQNVDPALAPTTDVMPTDLAPVVVSDGIREVYDPIEPVNRAIFRFNDAVDTVLIRPVAVTYRTVVPEPLRQNVTNVLRNMRTPVTLMNELLQGDWEGAEVAATRFFLNTLVGIGGLVDIAGTDKRLAYRAEDFGQTLAVWGVPEGPYLVLPLFGPSNARDTAGIIVDSLVDPVGFGLGELGTLATLGRSGSQFIDARSRTIDALDELEESSIDFYAAVRSAYTQSRVAEINDGAAAAPVIDIPVYDDFVGTQ